MDELENKKQQLAALEATIQQKAEYMQRLNDNNVEFKKKEGQDSSAILFSLKLADQIYNNMIKEKDELLKEIQVLEPTPEPIPEPSVEVVTEVVVVEVPIEEEPEVLNEDEAIAAGLKDMAADPEVQRDFQKTEQFWPFDIALSNKVTTSYLRDIYLKLDVICNSLKIISEALTKALTNKVNNEVVEVVKDKDGIEKED